MNKFKKNKGITLVALIITIIVLLILAVVSIRTVTGDGIIQYAKNARSEYEQAAVNEQALLDTYLEYLNNEIKPSGNSSSELFAAITASDYGKKIEYNDPAGVNNWKVFYKDEDYLYIITSDYLENTKLPSGLKMSKSSTYGVYWSSTSDFTSIGASTITSAVAKKYGLSWLADNNKSTNNNARATADLLNTKAWTEKFGDTAKGIEAIGGPTLEMWVASWNAKGYTKLYVDNYNTTGYYVGTESKPATYYQIVSGDTAGYGDTLYFPYQYNVRGCIGYWLISPSANLSDSVMCTSYDDGLEYDIYNAGTYTVRPIVSIPKSLITTTADGTLKVN